MGVKFATQSQKRSTRSARDTGTAELAHDTESLDCAACDTAVERGDAFTTEQGEICPACFVDREPSQQADLAGLYAGAGAAGLLALMWMAIVQEQRHWFVGMGALGWGLFGIAALVMGVFVLLTSIRLVRSGRPLSDDEAPDRLSQALGVGGVVFGVLASLAALFTTIYPYLIGLNVVPY